MDPHITADLISFLHWWYLHPFLIPIVFLFFIYNVIL